MANKYFIVTNKNGDKRLIQAKTKASALSYAIGTEFTCEPAKTPDVIELLASGGQIEAVGTSPTAPADQADQAAA